MKTTVTTQFKSSQYTIFVYSDGTVAMRDNQTGFPHALSNLPVMHFDVASYTILKSYSLTEIEAYFKKLAKEGNIAKLNRITCSDFQ